MGIDYAINDLPPFIPFDKASGDYENAWFEFFFHFFACIGNVLLGVSIIILKDFSPCNLTLLTYSISDFLIGLILLALPLNNLIYGGVSLSQFSCTFISATTVFSCFVSLSCCLALTFERYNLVVWKRNVTKESFYAYIIIVTNSYGDIYGLRSSYDICLVLWYRRNTVIGAIFIAICLFAIFTPSAVIGFAYYRICAEVKSTGKSLNEVLSLNTTIEVSSTDNDVPNSENQLIKINNTDVVKQEPYSKENNLELSSKKKIKSSQLELERRLLFQSISLCLCFLIGWTPVIFMIGYEIISGLPGPNWLLHLCTASPAFAIFVNPLTMGIFDVFKSKESLNIDHSNVELPAPLPIPADLSNKKYLVPSDLMIDKNDNLQLAIYYHEQEQRAVKLLQKAADSTLESLKFDSGISGSVINGDNNEFKGAVSTLKKFTAKTELSLVFFELGQSFRQGWGIEKNKQNALYYLTIAAQLGDRDAQIELGQIYLEGHLGVKADKKIAATWFREAIKNGAEMVGMQWVHKEKYDL
ncbi:hypothetical protein HK099_002171 [Clydaea vesicula]|uniref:G-protein coupled receptors family 1 profile domain-containing protein n=1 Tax=Clydaea vesicula TaxID=447962 RepID=A0AAD5U7N3_9FUNG|nr:hypothetical protein HK099_002171 [Clydaea vesicula]